MSHDDCVAHRVGEQANPRLLILYHASLSLRPAVDPESSTPARLLSEMTITFNVFDELRRITPVTQR